MPGAGGVPDGGGLGIGDQNHPVGIGGAQGKTCVQTSRRIQENIVKFFPCLAEQVGKFLAVAREGRLDSISSDEKAELDDLIRNTIS